MTKWGSLPSKRVKTCTGQLIREGSRLCCCSLSCVQLFATPWTQHDRLPCPSPTPGVCSKSCPSSRWCYSTILSSFVPISSFLQSFPASRSFPVSWLITSGLAKVLELQHQSFQWIFTVDFLKDWLVWSPCSPRDSQESSPAPQFKSINSLALNLCYGSTLTSIHDHWKNHSFDYMDLCWQSDVSTF